MSDLKEYQSVGGGMVMVRISEVQAVSQGMDISSPWALSDQVAVMHLSGGGVISVFVDHWRDEANSVLRVAK